MAEEASVRCNVRDFAQETFSVWRCADCHSIHARDEVDLQRHYARYPFHELQDDWRLRAVYDNQLRRLVRAGLQPDHAILDYGCGTGHFVEHLKRRGYRNAVGYDAYSERFADPEVLHRTYDCVVAQDVLEHVPAPNELLDQFALLSGPNAIIAVGTPNASAIDLTRPEPSIHALHMPYHRHILSKEALLTAGRQRGWELERFYSAEYGNTAIPFLNAPFMSFYMRVADNSIDALFEPPSLLPLATRLPITLFLGLFGCLLAREVDVMAVFRKEAQAEAPPPLRRERASQAVFAQSA